MLQADAAGAPLGAMRLTGYHYRGAAGAPPAELPARETQLRAALLLAAGSIGAADDAGADAGTRWPSLAALVDAVAHVETHSTVSGSDPDADLAVWTVQAKVPQALLGDGYPVARNASADTLLGVRRYRNCGRPGAGEVSPNGNVWNCLLSRTIDAQDVVPKPLAIDGEPVAPLPPPLGSS